ncbi:MAG TPA: nicotinate-nucleotide adenylyltransferase, partial [Arenicellales bacterium]|nr:nicotinate-nucleotide adenylyltransferase [Arenicellales bacterium]HJP25986.1 nicotinate-nucleotide adenylyltransferase [Arenicellales bacterium]
MEKQKSRKVGLFGGTFDPIHLGHLLTVNHVRQRVGLDSVHLVPAARPVHRSQPVASEQHRMEMVRLAVDDFPGLVADDRELRRQGKSYSIDTICSLRLDYPDVRFALIVGMDQALAFDSWHRWEE